MTNSLTDIDNSSTTHEFYGTFCTSLKHDDTRKIPLPISKWSIVTAVKIGWLSANYHVPPKMNSLLTKWKIPKGTTNVFLSPIPLL